MVEQVGIRILESDSNRRGDLFTRLLKDLLFALGYGDPGLNVHYAGREIDLQADHRVEPRRAVVEAKATKEKIGGDQLNKFAGLLERERRRNPGVEVTGFYVSLAGFTETALIQEKETSPKILIPLDGSQVIQQLISGRMLVPFSVAAERAGRCAKALPQLVLDSRAEVLAHERGWLWAIYYAQNEEITHFVLIHASGTPLSASIAQEIADADKGVGGNLYRLTSLNPTIAESGEALNVAGEKYVEYLRAECGFIFLDGLPADSDTGTRRLRLEQLFVPLHLHPIADERRTDQTTGEPKWSETIYLPIGRALTDNQRIAVLGAPGAGKSTLLKRIAMAYADPKQRLLSDDQLPAHSWFPLLLKCRDLRENANSPFPQLIELMAEKANLSRDLRVHFATKVERSLQDGTALLLIDGLDEISDLGGRTEFIENLRTLLAIYPKTAVVMTSREAGFRRVAGLIASFCAQMRIADFRSEDVRRLVISWHREVIGDTPQIISEAAALANTILHNDRIRQLAGNPLLLTTLLLVKRWVGQLPTRRAVLYERAVEVLLNTWNVQGYDSIEKDEALPQLAFVAFWMMQRGDVKISRVDLVRLLREARMQLAAELSFARVSVESFIRQVEERSSLMRMIGYKEIDGQLMEMYEFSHFTFQEYLTALAIAEHWYPNAQKSDTLVTVIASQLENVKWREVIPLAAVRAGNEAELLLEFLIGKCREVPRRISEQTSPAFRAIVGCLADEVRAMPDTVRSAIAELLSNNYEATSVQFCQKLANTKYASLLREQARDRFFARTPDYYNPGAAFAELVFREHAVQKSAEAVASAFQRFSEKLVAPDMATRCEGALGCLEAAYTLKLNKDISPEPSGPALHQCAHRLMRLLSSQEQIEQFTACWAYAWIGACTELRPPVSKELVSRLFELWFHGGDQEVNVFAAWALGSCSLLPRDSQPLDAGPELRNFLAQRWNAEDENAWRYQAAVAAVAFYVREPWTDSELIGMISDKLHSKSFVQKRTLKALLSALGPEGQKALTQFEALRS
jgi:NACHT domain-containing protein/restriction endonuclease